MKFWHIIFMSEMKYMFGHMKLFFQHDSQVEIDLPI